MNLWRQVRTLRGLFMVSRTGGDPPCVDSTRFPSVHSKRLRVCRQHAHTCHGPTMRCRRCESTKTGDDERPHSCVETMGQQDHEEVHQWRRDVLRKAIDKVIGLNSTGHGYIEWRGRAPRHAQRSNHTEGLICSGRSVVHHGVQRLLCDFGHWTSRFVCTFIGAPNVGAYGLSGAAPEV